MVILLNEIFIVDINKDKIKIYLSIPEDKYTKQNEIKELITTIKNYKNVLVKKNKHIDFKSTQKPSSYSILINLKKNKYIIISNIFQEYDLNEKINKFYSIIIGDELPYPYALSNENVYLFLENIYINKKYFKNFNFNKDNIYNYYTKNNLQKYSKKIKSKILKQNEIKKILKKIMELRK